MGQRIDLQYELEGILGSSNVYFQPPEGVKIRYDAIVYKRSTSDVKRADNRAYLLTRAYEVTAITVDPDSDLIDRIVKHFPMARPGRHYVADNLNHDTCTIYY